MANFWTKQTHHLNKMTLKDLVVAFFQYGAIQSYIVLAIASFAVTVVLGGLGLVSSLTIASLALVAYPVAWYFLHRFVLHGEWMYKSQMTAKVWKRIHYDHHQDPHLLEVLFGALYTTLPTIFLVTTPIGYAVGGIAGAALAFGCGLVITCVYEFMHCVQHLSYKPKNKLLKHMKQRHMEHHFQDETGNFGITSFALDKLFGTYFVREERPVKSATVFNLGYTAEQARKYPWVADQSKTLRDGTPRDQRISRKNRTETDKIAA